MELCEVPKSCEKTRSQVKSLVSSVSANDRFFFLGFALEPLPGVVHRSEFASGNSLQPAVVVCFHASVERHVSAEFGLPATCGLPL